MKIFEKNTHETFGYLLIHSVFLKEGRIRKGKIIDNDDIILMKIEVIEKVYVGEFEVDDISENS